ncbi:hypothetical protein ACHAXT_003678 [Thalassiosira profunda]
MKGGGGQVLSGIGRRFVDNFFDLTGDDSDDNGGVQRVDGGEDTSDGEKDEAAIEAVVDLTMDKEKEQDDEDDVGLGETAARIVTPIKQSGTATSPQASLLGSISDNATTYDDNGSSADGHWSPELTRRSGVNVHNMVVLPPGERQRNAQGDLLCKIDGCRTEALSDKDGLCERHHRLFREAGRQTKDPLSAPEREDEAEMGSDASEEEASCTSEEAKEPSSTEQDPSRGSTHQETKSGSTTSHPIDLTNDDCSSFDDDDDIAGDDEEVVVLGVTGGHNGSASMSRYNLRERPMTTEEVAFDGEEVEASSTVPMRVVDDSEPPEDIEGAKAESNQLFCGEHDDQCFMCNKGGKLLCCSFCEKAFHLSCHRPRLDEVPRGSWKCQECLAPELDRLFRCGECLACTRDDCGACRYCLDMPKFGGPGSLKQACVERTCPYKRYALPETVPKSTRTDEDEDDDSSKWDSSTDEESDNCDASCSDENDGSYASDDDLGTLSGGENMEQFTALGKNIDGSSSVNQKGGLNVRKRHRQPGKKRNKQKRKRPQKHRQSRAKARRPVNENMLQSPFNSQSSSGETSVGGLKILSIDLGEQKKGLNCFGEFFRHRTYEVTVSINQNPPDRKLWLGGRCLELVSAKLPRKSNGRFEVKKMSLMYVATEGPGLDTINLQAKLDSFASFSSLSPVKAVARLAHLQSNARKIGFTDVSKIEFIEERGNEGCGFFPRGFFDGWGPRTDYDSVQVRIMGPTIGLFKGMLLAKEGIAAIQLPRESMMKAPPSEACDEDWVCVVLKNVFPGDANKQLGKHLDPDESARASYTNPMNKLKKISKMYRRMLIGYGVRKDDVAAYAKASRDPAHLKHAHLKGVADPTGKIPEGRVFITGYVANGDGERVLFGQCFNQIYVSRSPSVAPGDAKILSVLSEKTNDMSEEEWGLLCSYKWGTIIFGAPVNSCPIPSMIADGDLDGDDYFVLWEPQMLSHLLTANDELTRKSRRLLLELKMPEKAVQSVNKDTPFSGGDDDWLSKAQDQMLDFPAQNAATNIVGQLYKLCVKASKRPGGNYDIFDEDAVAYAQAYKDSMDIQKHGGRIYLPEHLHHNVKESLRALLV